MGRFEDEVLHKRDAMRKRTADNARTRRLINRTLNPPEVTGCLSCNAPMPGKRIDAKFCSNACRQAHYRGKSMPPQEREE